MVVFRRLGDWETHWRSCSADRHAGGEGAQNRCQRWEAPLGAAHQPVICTWLLLPPCEVVTVNVWCLHQSLQWTTWSGRRRACSGLLSKSAWLVPSWPTRSASSLPNPRTTAGRPSSTKPFSCEFESDGSALSNGSWLFFNGLLCSAASWGRSPPTATSSRWWWRTTALAGRTGWSAWPWSSWETSPTARAARAGVRSARAFTPMRPAWRWCGSCPSGPPTRWRRSWSSWNRRSVPRRRADEPRPRCGFRSLSGAHQHHQHTR